MGRIRSIQLHLGVWLKSLVVLFKLHEWVRLWGKGKTAFLIQHVVDAHNLAGCRGFHHERLRQEEERSGKCNTTIARLSWSPRKAKSRLIPREGLLRMIVRSMSPGVHGQVG